MTALPAHTSDKTLCFGGSFNPPHVGHLVVARAAAEAAGLAKVQLIVAGVSPHKVGHADTPAAALRVEMCRLAVAGDNTFLVDDRETRRPGRSFSADTADELRHEAGNVGPVNWLIGSDLLAGLPTWHRAGELLANPPSLIRFVVAVRPGAEPDWNSLPAGVRHLKANVVKVPRLDVSSTDLRRRASLGLSLRHLTPDPVRGFIHRVGLYSASAP